MRQGLFATLLVLAAFAGGAFINGPGLAWVQDKIGDLVEGGPAEGFESAEVIDNEVEVVVVEAASPPVEATPAAVEAPAAPVAAATPPMAPPPPFQVQPEDAHGGGVPTPPAAEPPTVAAPRGPTLVANPAELRTATAISDTGPASAAPPSPEAPRPLAEPPEGALAPPVNQAAEPWPDAPGSAPAAAIVPGQAPPGSPVDPRLALATGQPAASHHVPAPASASIADDQGMWDQLQQQMKDLGVVRYWFEGEVGGRVRYRCLVPVVGEQVVSQHFEADGETVFQAAQAALRRVALWRAAQEP